MRILKTLLGAAGAALIAGPALAHPGHGFDDGFGVGALHPLTGFDHTLAMVAVGLWAGLALRKACWVWPATFVAFMLAGFALAANGVTFPAVETVIAASVVGLGLAAGFGLKVPAVAGSAAIAVFAAAHGFAHGQEVPAGAPATAFATGFTVSTIALHAAGLGLSWMGVRFSSQLLARAAGFGIAVAGLAMAFG